MATIQRVKNKKGYSYRAIVRNIGLKEVSKTFPNRQLANQFIYKMESDRQARALYGGRNSNKLFYEIATDYLKYEYRGCRPKQQQYVTNYWLDILGDKMVSDITTSDISRGMEVLPNRLSNATKNRYKAAISVVFSYACREYGLHINPVRNIPSLPENNESKGLDVLWARRKIESLTDLYYFDRTSAQQKAIRKDITSIALKHHLVSKFTSLVAVDVTPNRPEGEIIVTQPLFNKFKALIESELSEIRVPAAIQMNQVIPNYASTNTWKCNAGYIKSGNSCKKIIGQINSQLASSVNASRTATNSELLIYLGLVIMLLAAILRRRQSA